MPPIQAPPPLTARQALLVHQVHPVKLAADIGASLLSLALLWRGHRRTGMAVHFAGPLLGSAVVLSTADLPRLAITPAGRYVQQHMPPAAQALRLAGDALTVRGARRHSFALIAAGLAVVAAGWSHGLLPTATAARSSVGPVP
jgi:hypothetical protein